MTALCPSPQNNNNKQSSPGIVTAKLEPSEDRQHMSFQLTPTDENQDSPLLINQPTNPAQIKSPNHMNYTRYPTLNPSNCFSLIDHQNQFSLLNSASFPTTLQNFQFSHSNSKPTSPKTATQTSPLGHSVSTSVENSQKPVPNNFSRELLEMFYNYNACRYGPQLTSGFHNMANSEVHTSGHNTMPFSNYPMGGPILPQIQQWASNSPVMNAVSAASNNQNLDSRSDSNSLLDQNDSVISGHKSEYVNNRYTIDKILDSTTSSKDKSKRIQLDTKSSSSAALKGKKERDLSSSTFDSKDFQVHPHNNSLFHHQQAAAASLMLTQHAQAALMRQWQQGQILNFGQAKDSDQFTGTKKNVDTLSFLTIKTVLTKTYAKIWNNPTQKLVKMRFSSAIRERQSSSFKRWFSVFRWSFTSATTVE